jgi:hypothetical protein
MIQKIRQNEYPHSVASTGSATGQRDRFSLAVLILLLIISLIVSRFLKESGLIHDSKNKAE